MKKNLQTRIMCIIAMILGAISNVVLSDGTFLVLCILLFGPLLIFPECYYAEYTRAIIEQYKNLRG